MARALFESSTRRAGWPRHNIPASLARLRVVPLQLDQVELVAPVAEAFAAFVSLLRAAGADVVRTEIAAWRPAVARRAGLLVSEEGASYYIRHLGAELSGLSPALAGMLRYPEKAGLARLVAAYEEIEAVRIGCRRTFAEVDLLALPTAAQPSFAHGDAPPVDQADLTALANFARCAAFSLPFGGDPFPAGMQLIAPAAEDEWLLEIAALAEAAMAGHRSG